MLDTTRAIDVPEGVELSLAVAGLVSRSLAFIIDLFIRWIGLAVVSGNLAGHLAGGASDTRRFAAHRCDAHGGIKDDNFGVITVLHGETGSRAERPQRLESHAD